MPVTEPEIIWTTCRQGREGGREGGREEGGRESTKAIHA
jgi:hypothetical protein